MKNTDDLATSLRTLMHSLRSRQMRSIMEFSREHKLKFPHISVLHRLLHEGAMNVSDMGNFLEVSNAAVSQMIDKLVGAGLVSRKEDSEDRRVKLIEMTPVGRDMMSELHRNGNRWIEDVMKTLAPDEIEQIGRSLDLLNSRLAEEEENDKC